MFRQFDKFRISTASISLLILNLCLSSSLPFLNFLSMNDIIFEHREKAYGAYFLRTQGHWFQWIALALVCSWVCGAAMAMNLRQIEEKVKEKDHGIICCCLGILPPPLEELRPKPCKEKQKLISIKIPVPVPAWKLCDCDPYADPKQKKLSSKIKNYKIQLAPEPPNLHELLNWGHCISCPKLDDLDLARVTVDSVLDKDFFLVPNQEIDEDPILLNPAVFPKALKKKLDQGELSLNVLIHADGSYRKHKQVGKLSKRLQKKLDALMPQLVFSPAIRDGELKKDWVVIGRVDAD